jgi:hypothetical protein
VSSELEIGLSGYQKIRAQVIRTAEYQVKEQKTEDRRLRTEDRRRKVEICSKGNALDKHVVLLVNEKYYVSSYKLLRLIIELRGNLIKICARPAEVS